MQSVGIRMECGAMILPPVDGMREVYIIETTKRVNVNACSVRDGWMKR